MAIYIYIYIGQPTNYSIFWSHFLLKESRLTYMMTDTIQATNSFPIPSFNTPETGDLHIFGTRNGGVIILYVFALTSQKTSRSG